MKRLNYHEKRIEKVDEICSKLDCSKEIERGALNLLEKVEDENIHLGKSSRAIASACIYIASHGNINQNNIASSGGSIPVTTRENFQEIVGKLNIKIGEKAKTWNKENIPMCYCKEKKSPHKAHLTSIEDGETKSRVRIKKLSDRYSKGYSHIEGSDLWRAYRPNGSMWKPLRKNSDLIEAESREEIISRLKKLNL